MFLIVTLIWTHYEFIYTIKKWLYGNVREIILLYSIQGVKKRSGLLIMVSKSVLYTYKGENIMCCLYIRNIIQYIYGDQKGHKNA